LSPALKIVWGAITYIFFGMAYTVCDVPIFSMTSAITDQIQERVSIMTRNTVVAAVAMLAITIAAPQLYLRFGWFAAALIIAVPGTACMLYFVRVAKERYVNKDTEPVTLKAMFSYVRNNRFLLIFFGGLFVMNMTATTQAVAPYFATANLGNPGLASILFACVALPAMFVALFMPLLTKRLDKFHILLFASITNGALGIISFFVGYGNFPVFIALLLLRGIFMGTVLVTQLLFTADLVEYGEFKTGKRLQGTAYSIQTFTFQLFNAVAVSGAMFILGIFGFVEGAGAVQGPVTRQAIWVLLTLFPAVGILLSLPILTRYRLRDKDVQLMARVNSGEMPREEAEAAFSYRY
jgi:probable glucitol transport protein GutA